MKFPAFNGFLFPVLTLNSINPQTKEATLYINPHFVLSWGKPVVIDTLFFGNIKKTSPKLLYKDLKFLIGQSYSDKTNTYIKQSLKKYSFIGFDNNSQIVLTQHSNYGLLINLNEHQSNKYSGIIGYVPKTSNKAGYFTGQIDIGLKNISGSGRAFNIFWSKVNENSQEFRLNYFEPHVFKSQYFTNIGFGQILRDTLVVIRNLQFGLGKNISNKGIIELTLDYESTLPTPSGREILNLDNNKIFKGGLKYSFDNRDLPSNPSYGLYINIHNHFGFYKTDNKQKIMTQASLYGEINFTLARQLVIHCKSTFRGKFIQNSKIDYSGQLWFGGANNLRGYPEDFFSGSKLGMISSEIRWITGYYSRIFVFFDQGYYKNLKDETKWPFSFGLGMRLESRMGTIGLDYAFGEDDTFTTAKIHIHLENRF